MPKIGGRRKKARSQKQGTEDAEEGVPKTFVFKKGKCTQQCKDLALDFRKCFYPHTAMKLEDSNKISMKSYLKAAKYYNVTHMVAFQQSKQKTFARFIKVGGGQMLFRVLNYCRMKDVVKNNGQPFNFSLHEPLIVLNNFAENNQVRQIGRSIQEMFPSINLEKINLEKVKRVLSFTYQPNKKCIYFRHYKIVVKEGGLNDSFKLLTKKIHSDMSQFKSFGEFLNKSKESEDEKHTGQNQREVKLAEMGPRMKLKFISFDETYGRIQFEEQEEQPQQNDRRDGQSNELPQREQQVEKVQSGLNKGENQQVEELRKQFTKKKVKTIRKNFKPKKIQSE